MVWTPHFPKKKKQLLDVPKEELALQLRMRPLMRESSDLRGQALLTAICSLQGSEAPHWLDIRATWRAHWKIPIDRPIPNLQNQNLHVWGRGRF